MTHSYRHTLSQRHNVTMTERLNVLVKQRNRDTDKMTHSYRHTLSQRHNVTMAETLNDLEKQRNRDTQTQWHNTSSTQHNGATIHRYTSPQHLPDAPTHHPTDAPSHRRNASTRDKKTVESFETLTLLPSLTLARFVTEPEFFFLTTFPPRARGNAHAY